MTAELTDTAHIVARLVARRQTPRDEIAALVQNVHRALLQLSEPPQHAAESGEAAAVARERAPAQARPRQPLSPGDNSPPTEADEPVAPPMPKLRRRAEVIAATPAAEPAFEVPSRVLRGVVKWFDAQSRRGALRLPKHGGDLPIDGALLAEMGISRLYKGQEIEATLSDDGESRVVRLALPGGASPTLTSSGIVRGRQAKPVVVELKRESLRRVAARAEAELLLRPGRAR